MSKRTASSVRELIKMVSATPEQAQDTIAYLDARRLSVKLAVLRSRHGLSQKQLAEKAGWTQGKVSKLEHQKDADISVGDLNTYCSALGVNLEIGFTNVTQGKLADRVKYHFLKMQAALDQIYKIADGDEEIQRAGKPFMNEVMNNLFIAMQRCEKQFDRDVRGHVAAKSEKNRLIVTSDMLEEPAVAS